MDVPALILDVDEVVVQYVAAFEGWLRRAHGIEPRVPHAEERGWDLGLMYPHVPQEARGPLYAAFAVDPAFAAMPFVPGAAEAIAAFRAERPDVPVHAVTSCGDDGPTRRYRLENLAPLGLDGVLTLPRGAAKADAYRRFPEGSVVVDDLARHVAEAAAEGHRGILLARPHNRDSAAAERAADWGDLLGRLLDHAWGGPAPAPAR